MNNNWKLSYFDPGIGIQDGCLDLHFDDSQWLNIEVPGDVHHTLIDAGIIPDPYYNQNEFECAWMEEKEWWYRLRFTPDEAPLRQSERLQLMFNGIDTFATIWLNGEKLASTDNMFHAWTFDVSQKLLYGQENILALCFEPPLQHVDPDKLPDYSIWGRNPERVFMRKAQFGYGWDWGPRLPTIGLWRSVEMQRQRVAAIDGVHFYTLEINQQNDQAVVAVRVEIDRFASESPLNVAIQLQDATGHEVAKSTLLAKDDVATAYLVVDNPRLWWTHDLGIPYLYTLSVTLTDDDQELDTDSQRVGIRTIELDQSVDTSEPGTRFFRFVLNGIPVFARGACWIPTDSFVGAIPESLYEHLLTSAQTANMTMLRIWGGGIYEHDIFYDLCDQLGIMVWQDFMFACAMYPEYDPQFVASVRREATYQVKRLRSRACLVLWCGNNENQWIHDRVMWQGDYQQVPGTRYYHDILPEVVATLDGQIAYWPGSPYGGNDHASMQDGNRHNWEVWHGNGYHRHFGEEPEHENTVESVSYLRYAEDMGRFISEFGMHAAPVRTTLEKAVPEDQLYHHSPSMDHHNKDNPKNKGDNLMIGVTGLPETLDEYIDFSMVAQAEGLKFGIEHFRRRKPHCSGTLVWQLNDCWPVLSWSMMDYYGTGKASYYYVKRVFEPVIASFKAVSDNHLQLWITNDSLEIIEDTAIVQLQSFAGDIDFTEEISFSVPINSSQMIAEWDGMEPDMSKFLSVQSKGNAFEANRHFFGMVKAIAFASKPIEHTIRQLSPHELQVELSCASFAYFVHIETHHSKANFSDNYFDILPNEAKSVTITNPDDEIHPDDIVIDYWQYTQ